MDSGGVFFNSNDYELTNEYLNQGVFGRIRKIKKISDEKEYCAKIININTGLNGSEQMSFINQSIIFSKLSHPTIVNFVGINFQSLEDRSVFEPTIINEYLPKGSLQQFLDKDEQNISDPNWNSTTKCITILGISHAMKFLHEHQILHRDLKPENILFDDNFYPHVSDYGLANCFTEAFKKLIVLVLTKNFQSPAYFAPELFEDEKENLHNNLKIDVFSFGIIACQILTGKVPYSDLGKLSSAKLVSKIIEGARPEFTENVSQKMKKLIKRCLSKNVDERPSFDQICSELNDFKSYFADDVDKDEVSKYLKLISKEEKSGHSENGEVENGFDKEKRLKRLNNERKNYAEIIEVLMRNVNDVDEIEIKKNSLLQSACNVGNLDLVKYIMESDEIDINEKGVFFIFGVLMLFQIILYLLIMFFFFVSFFYQISIYFF